MATNTAKLGLTKPGYSDTADIQVLNDNFDDIDSALGGMSIIINGNKTAYSSGASIGQYVTLINSTIVDSGDVMLPDGVYTAAKAIPYNTAIDKTYLTAVAGGALNALNSNIATKLDASKIIKWVNVTKTFTSSGTTDFQDSSITSNSVVLVTRCVTTGSSIVFGAKASSGKVTISAYDASTKSTYTGSTNLNVLVINE